MRQLQVWLIAVAALAGILASGLWLWTGQKSWKGEMLERRVNLGEPVSAKTLVNVWAQIRSLDQSFLPGTHVHLPGLVSRLIITEESIPVEKRAEVLLAGEKSIENGLAREPANSAAWARLAWIRYIQNGPSPDVLAALRMSIYTAPANRSLLFWRIEMAGLNRDFWDADFESLIRRQIIYASRASEKQLYDSLQSSGLEDFMDGIPSSTP